MKASYIYNLYQHCGSLNSILIQRVTIVEMRNAIVLRNIGLLHVQNR